MQWDYGKFILKQLDYSPSFSMSDSQLCSKKTRARSLIVNYKTGAVFLSSYKNTSGSLGEQEMLCEHKP